MNRISNITPEMMLAAGYKHFHDTLHDRLQAGSYLGSYQKRFDDEFGKRYFITFNHGRFSVNGITVEYTTPYVQFTSGAGTFNVEFLHHGEAIEQVETFFEKLWKAMGCEYYERTA